MKKGFLIIDACMNTFILSLDDYDVNNFLMKNIDLKEVHRNHNLKELDKDVRNYLKGRYEENNNDTNI